MPPVKAPNVDPRCFNLPRRSEEGFEQLCHLVSAGDPDLSLCGRDVTGHPWDPPWPLCEACLAVSRGQLN